MLILSSAIFKWQFVLRITSTQFFQVLNHGWQKSNNPEAETVSFHFIKWWSPNILMQVLILTGYQDGVTYVSQ